jgi:endothelin-converting enzyme/putative endopeptidase
MRRQLFAFVFVAVPLAAGFAAFAAGAPAPRARAAASASGVELAALDRTMDPCTDFYQFACGGWIAANPLPPDRRSWTRFSELQDKNFDVLRRVLEGRTAGSRDLARARGYYAACMDEPAIEKKGLAPLQPEFARIQAVASLRELPALVARLQAADGASVFFTFAGRPDFKDASQEIAGLGPSGLSLPDRDYYLKTDERSDRLRRGFRATVEKLLALSGTPAADAAHDADAIVAIETALARGMMDVAARRDPHARDHSMGVAGLRDLAPSFDWTTYFRAAGAPAFDQINVAEPEAVKSLESVLQTTSVGDVRAYLRWHVLHANVAMLPKAFEDADFDFFSRTLAGQQREQPRWRRCIAQTDQHLGEALGQAFVEEAFGPQAKADTRAMVEGIKAALGRDIDSLPWMTADTKVAAHRKLAAVVDRIGYPDTWRDYTSVQISREDALGNLQHARAFERARAVTRIGKPVDKGEWNMTPPTVNAYYSPPSNNINFPAGILQPPFYEADRDAAVNYGGAGAVIGHELTHGFDDQGRKYDGQGNLREWWSGADATAFEERATCVADQYSSYTVAGDTHINGRLTLGENTADNGGVRLALLAYLAGPGATPQPTLDGFTPEQRLFLGWAQVWCANSRPESERLQALTNPHSASRYRVNGPLSNMPEFQRAFSCKADAPMVRANACRVW